MPNLKNHTPRIVIIWGYFLFASGLGLAIQDNLSRSHFWVPSDLGFIIGYSAVMLFGLTCTFIGESLQSLEQRVKRIEERLERLEQR